MEQKLNEIIAGNKYKNNMLRNTLVPNINNYYNIQLETDQSFSSIDLEKPIELILNFPSPAQYVKIIYRFENEHNDGNIKLFRKHNNESQFLFDIGNFANSSVVYYCNFKEVYDELVLSINSKGSFYINQLEFVEISYVEYKAKKINQYVKKIRRMLQKQPHLKRKFIDEFKRNGFKAVYNKVKQKLYKNENYNDITISTDLNITNTKVATNSILVISHDAHRGGASVLALHIVRVLKEQFNKDIYVILLQGGPFEKEFTDYAQVYNLNQSSLSFLENDKQVNEVLRELKKRGVSNCISNSVVSSILLNQLHENGFKTISLIHELPTSIKTYNFFEAAKYTTEYADKIIFPNNFVKDAFLKEYVVNEANLVIKPQGLYRKSNLFHNKAKAKNMVCKKLDIPHNSKIILGCGYADLRKGLDCFFGVANEIIKNNKNVHFLWLGDREPLLEKWLLHDATQLNISNNIHFMEYEPEPSYIFAGVDVFLLTSREDPFPSVVLEAMDNGTPVLSFDDAGGVPELISKIGGNSIPYLNVKLMAEEVMKILIAQDGDEDVYNSMILNAKKIIEQDYDFNSYVNCLLQYLGEDTDGYNNNKRFITERPFKVSVIVPNYNYEKFLNERLYSIINQTYAPFEIIFLDDVSIDNSIEIAEKILENSNIKFKIIKNDFNVGCFGQWKKGIQEAEGDLIWVAEADDVCELNFLEKVANSFMDQEVNLSYSQSQIIDEHSNKIPYKYTEYTEDLSKEKWLKPYTIEGRVEIVEGLGIKNTIPNASAVVMRKSALEGIGEIIDEYFISGDWLAYVYVLKLGKISFNPQILNYHRRHSQSIISVKEQSSELYLELIKVKRFILQNYEIPNFIKNDFLNHIKSEYERLGCRGISDRNIYNNAIVAQEYKTLIDETNHHIDSLNYLQKRKKILFVTPDLEVGGGQMLVIRLANYFAAYQIVYIYNSRPWLVTEQMLKMISSNVKILNSTGDPNELKRYIEEENIEVINSHIWWSDKIVNKALKNKSDVKWIISMHGCYEGFIENPQTDIEFEVIINDLLNKADNIIYATDKNTEIFSKVKLQNKSKTHKIYYGYSLQGIASKSRSQLGIEQDDFVFGLISRAIKEKGWEESIQAVIKLNDGLKKPSHLILVGKSDYSLQLKEKYKKNAYIHFIDEFTVTSEWIGWLKIFDVAILPSYYVSESLPNSIIEYLAYQKPVIATNIGDIKHMIRSDTENIDAGILLNLNEQKVVEINDIVEAMQIMITNKSLFEEYKKNTELLFQQFKMSRFASNYFELF